MSDIESSEWGVGTIGGTDPLKRNPPQERIDYFRKACPEWSERLIYIYAAGRGPIIQDEKPDWPHESGAPWARGTTSDGKICWV